MSNQKFNPWWIVYAVFAIIVIAFVFGGVFHRNPGCEVSGWDALGQMSIGAWIWTIVGTAGVAYIAYRMIKSYKAGGELSHSAMFAAVAFLFIVWFPMADIKANCGTTGTKGNPTNQIPKDDGRIPAEDLLPQ